MAAPLLTYEGYHGLMGGAIAGFAGGANGSRVRLFKNNLFPAKTTVWTEFVENDFSGYAPIAIPAAADLGLDPANIDIWKFGQVIFTMTTLPMQVAYGYWLDFVNPLTLVRQSLWVQRFDSPFLFNAPGCKLPITLTPGFRQG
jgi:hypothetical protein